MKLIQDRRRPRFPLLLSASLLALAFLAPVRAAEPPDLRMVLKQEFILVKDWNALPASLRDLIFAHMDERDRSMAEPGQPYQQDCVVLEPLPARRLIFAARSGSTYIVCYESGGIEETVHLVLSPLGGQDLTHFILYSPRDIDDLATVRALVGAGKYGASEHY